MRRLSSHVIRLRFIVVAILGILVVPVLRLNAVAQSAGSSSTVAAGKLTSDFGDLWFHAVNVGSAELLRFRITNHGPSQIVVSKITPASTMFQVIGVHLPLTLAVNQTVPIFVKFWPKSAIHIDSSITLANNGSVQNFIQPVHGTGVATGSIGISPAAVSFGNVQVGSSKSGSITVNNTGTANLTLFDAQVTGGAGFYVTGLTLPLTLAPSHSVTFGVLFKPQTSASASASLALVNDHSARSVALSGTGTGAGNLSVSPGALSFGTITLGLSKTAAATLVAGGANVTVTSASVTSSEFAVSGLSFPFTIASGQSKAYSVTFKPGASGAVSANVTFVSGAGQTISQSLTGTGSAAAAHSVKLSWTRPSTSVTGFNVYRSSNSGGSYSKINSALDSTTAYVDSAVLAGQTYYYVVTSVDTNGTESVHSGQVGAAIPTP
jgi:hypothetical protein